MSDPEGTTYLIAIIIVAFLAVFQVASGGHAAKDDAIHDPYTP